MTRNLIMMAALLLMVSCQGREAKKQQEEADQNIKLSPEELLQLNREMVNRDMETLIQFAQKHHWDYVLQDNGLIYEILRDSSGQTASAGDKVFLNYLVMDLNHQELYSTKRSGHLLSFVVSYEDIEAGLNDMVLKMSTGDSIRCLLPPHLAFGITGDGDRVPPRTSLVYYLKLNRIEHQ